MPTKPQVYCPSPTGLSAKNPKISGIRSYTPRPAEAECDALALGLERYG